MMPVGPRGSASSLWPLGLSDFLPSLPPSSFALSKRGMVKTARLRGNGRIRAGAARLEGGVHRRLHMDETAGFRHPDQTNGADYGSRHRPYTARKGPGIMVSGLVRPI